MMDDPELHDDSIEVARIGLADALGMLAFSQVMTVREYLGDDE